MLLLLTSTVFAVDVVQVSVVRDSSGQWINPTPQVVTWDVTVYTTVGDPKSTSTTSLQHWAFPFDDGWIKASFNRPILGEYSIRWSRDGELWSDWNSHTIIKPGNPRGN
jgi:hypothetical protein